jgi:hypothetical protein
MVIWVVILGKILKEYIKVITNPLQIFLLLGSFIKFIFRCFSIN